MHEPPADADARTNRLPSPEEQFALIIQALLDGSYRLPNEERK